MDSDKGQESSRPSSSSSSWCAASNNNQSVIVHGDQNQIINETTMMERSSSPVRTLPRCYGALEIFIDSGGILEQIDQKFRMLQKTADVKHRIVVLTGFGGMGKSSTVRRFAKLYEKRQGNEHKVTWINMDTEETAIRSFIRLAKHFQLEPWKKTHEHGMEQSQVEDLVRDVYAHFSDHVQTGLFIMDQAKQFHTTESQDGTITFGISQFLPNEDIPHCPLFLLTSRSSIWSKFGSEIPKIQLKPWSPNETRNFLLKILGLDETNPDPDSPRLMILLEKLNGKYLRNFPLAANMAAKMIRIKYDSIPFSEVSEGSLFPKAIQAVKACLKLFQTDVQNLLSYSPPPTIHVPGDNYDHTIDAVMKASISQIEHEPGYDQALRLLSLIAYLPNELISVELCHFIMKDEQLSPLFFKTFKDVEETKNGFHLLEKCSFVTVHQERRGLFNSFYEPLFPVWVHNIVQMVVRQNLADSGRYESLKMLSQYVVKYIEFFESEIASSPTDDSPELLGADGYTPSYIRSFSSGDRKVVLGPRGYFPISRKPNKSLLKALKEHVEEFKKPSWGASQLYPDYIFLAIYSSKSQRLRMLRHACEALTNATSLEAATEDLKEWLQVCQMALDCFQTLHTTRSSRRPFGAQDYDTLLLMVDQPQPPQQIHLKSIVNQCLETALKYRHNVVAQMVLPYVFRAFGEPFLESIGTNPKLGELEKELRSWIMGYTAVIPEISRPLSRHWRRISWAIFRLIRKIYPPAERMGLLSPLIHAHVDRIDEFWRWQYAGVCLEEFQYNWTDGDCQGRGRNEQVGQFLDSQGVSVLILCLYSVANDVKTCPLTYWPTMFNFLELIQAIAYFEGIKVRLEMLIDGPEFVDACLKVTRVALKFLKNDENAINKADQWAFHFELLLDIALIWYALSTGLDDRDRDSDSDQVQKCQAATLELWIKVNPTMTQFHRLVGDGRKLVFGPHRPLPEIRTRVRKILKNFIASMVTPFTTPQEMVADLLEAKFNISLIVDGTVVHADGTAGTKSMNQ